MLLLIFCSKGCHLNTRPNEPRPDTCQLHEGFAAAMHNVPGIIFPTSGFVVEGVGSSLCTLTLLAAYISFPFWSPAMHISFLATLPSSYNFGVIVSAIPLSVVSVSLSTFTSPSTRILLPSELCLALILISSEFPLCST